VGAGRADPAGQSLDYAYRLHWCDRDPYPGELALCIATRLGRGGMKGAPRSTTLRTFVIEFKGAILASLAEGQTPEPVLEATHGKFLFIEVDPAPQGGQDHWRLRFDLDPDGADVVDLRCALRFAGKTLTETWRYHYIRFESPDR
jgi:Periplasmic glucans biosynthesis protein